MEYTYKESFIKRLWNKIKNSTIASIFNNNIDVPSSNAELYEQITSTGLPIDPEEIKKINKSFQEANESLTKKNDENDRNNEKDKFIVDRVNVDPKAPVSTEPNLTRAPGGREHVE